MSLLSMPLAPVLAPRLLGLLGWAAFSAIATEPLSVNAQTANAQTANARTANAQLTSAVIAQTPEPLVSPAVEGTITPYADESMSFDFPADWQVETIKNGLMIANVTTVESELVATQVVRIAAPPGPVVNANIDSFIEEGSAVGRYRTVEIDGQEALVMWLSERPDELTGAIATFIDYGDETILLFSRYSPDNETAEADILRLHTSFANLAAEDESPSP